ncbi:LMAN1 [Lepeophtheirus salmonis]|uniref:LMAN1 n=1 Tax=Lepeophtheirus salmonis TaxID=72036 RepID=A0A7R8HBE2_LEPSM|nr:LMAN1 [Lepeophtheirus salmonis]CAF2971918.1 LMAN1 [Lepeophtheirus salmonis]
MEVDFIELTQSYVLSLLSLIVVFLELNEQLLKLKDEEESAASGELMNEKGEKKGGRASLVGKPLFFGIKRDVRFKMKIVVLLGILSLSLALTSALQSPSPTFRERFEYKHSFKPPYLAQKDGSVPFFEYSGNAIASHESVRITPSLRSQKGRGRVGADVLTNGMDWVSSLTPLITIISTITPYIMAMGNDGTIGYDHQNDGSTQQLAGCLRDFRNKPFPVKAKIEFFNNILTVFFHNGISNNDKDFELCLRVENMFLPKTGYFGISAATGGLADDHDVLRFSVSSLHPTEQGVPFQAPSDAESKKFEMEFEEYQKKLKDQKDQWAIDNPEQAKAKEDHDDWSNWFSDSDKELQQIFQGQSAIKDTINDLHRKMDEIIGRQERTLSLLSAGGQGFAQGNQPPPMPQGGAGGGVPVDTIRRDEVNVVLSNQREIVSTSRDIKNFVSDIHSKANQLLNRGSSQPIGGGADPGQINEMRDSLNAIKRDLNTVSKKNECPQAAASTTGGSPCVFQYILFGVYDYPYYRFDCIFDIQGHCQLQIIINNMERGPLQIPNDKEIKDKSLCSLGTPGEDSVLYALVDLKYKEGLPARTTNDIERVHSLQRNWLDFQNLPEIKSNLSQSVKRDVLDRNKTFRSSIMHKSLIDWSDDGQKKEKERLARLYYRKDFRETS